MSWVRIDDAFDDNPKVEELSDAAFRLYVTTLCWCSRHSTDGHVTLTVAKKRGTLKAIRELLDANLWLEVPGGYEVNDYLAYNPSKAEVAARREAIGKRVRKHRGNGNCNAVTDDAQTALPKESETPLPRAGARDAGVRARVSRPDPSRPSQTAELLVRCPQDLWEQFPDDAKRTLETAGVPRWAQEQICKGFAAKQAGKTGGERRLDAWFSTAVTVIQGNWNDPNRRPKKPQPETPKQTEEELNWL